MFKLFKSVDEKLADIGFKKVQDTPVRVEYIRSNKNEFVQLLEIYADELGCPVVKSTTRNGALAVSLTKYELQLIIKKMDEKNLDYSVYR